MKLKTATQKKTQRAIQVRVINSHIPLYTIPNNVILNYMNWTTMATEIQIDPVKEARDLLAKATPWPWRMGSFGDRPEVQGDLASGNNGYPCRQILTMGFAHVEWGALNSEVQQELRNDAELIARAPELLKTLADEVERLRNIMPNGAST